MRRRVQRAKQRRRAAVRAGLSVPGSDHGPEHRRVDESAAQLRGAERGAHRGAEQRPGGYAFARIRVQAREIAAGVEAREPTVDFREHRRRVDVAVGVAYDPGDCAHRREAVVEHRSSFRSGAGPRELAAGPCPHRRPVAGQRSGPGSIGSSPAAEAGAAARASAGAGAARPLRRPPPRRRG